jgi:hypothetical protein
MNTQAVKDFFEHYHRSITKNPDLYRNGGDMITVVLPKELLDYSNAAAGHSGFGSGARPVGIRRKVRNAERELAEIFQSVDSLQKFIESSERDGPAYVEEVRRRHAEKSTPKPVMAADPSKGFWAVHDKSVMAEIKARTKDHQQLIEDYKTMTLTDFEERYMAVA